MNTRTVAFIALGILTSAQARAVVITESFDDISGLGAAGWSLINNSSPGGTTSWFQGNDGVFASQAGAPDSYAAANFFAAGAGGNISLWLLTPSFTFDAGASLSFYTRDEQAGFADRLQVRFSAGAGADVGATDSSVGSFTTLFLTLNPALAPDGYPGDWTQFTINLSALSGLSGRMAFRYFVTDTNVNGNYIGIDTFALNTGGGTDPNPTPIPEPSTLLLLPLGAAILAARRRLIAK